MRFKNQMLLKGVRNKFFLNTVDKNNYGDTPKNDSNVKRNRNKMILATSDTAKPPKPLNARELRGAIDTL